MIIELIDRNGQPYQVEVIQDPQTGTMIPISGLKNTNGEFINPATKDDIDTLTAMFNVKNIDLVGNEEGIVVRNLQKSNDLVVKGTSTAGAALTVTLPAGGTGMFHIIEKVFIQAYNTAARTGGATPVTVTTTNLPNTPSILFSSAGAIGTIEDKVMCGGFLKSSVANTATTIVCPITASVIWNVIVHYRLGT